MSTRRVSVGSDSHIINGRLLTAFAHEDCVVHEFSEDISAMVKGKNGNTIITYHPQGEFCKSVYKILRGSDDHAFLLNLKSAYQADPAGFVLLTGESTKVIGDGSGNRGNNSLNFSAGTFRKFSGMKDNASGDPTQAVVEFEITWGEVVETIS